MGYSRSKAKKGDFDIKSIILWLILGGILLLIVFKLRGLYNQVGGFSSQFVHGSMNYTNEFNFTAETLSIDTDDNICSKRSGTTGSNAGADAADTDATKDSSSKNANAYTEYDCKAGSEVYFETTIKNGGAASRRFFGGVIVCKAECTQKGACTVSDKSCFDNTISSTESCTINPQSSQACDGGSYTFEKGTYFVLPIATCFIDSTNGCSGSGLTGSPTSYNSNAYIKVIAS